MGVKTEYALIFARFFFPCLFSPPPPPKAYCLTCVGFDFVLLNPRTLRIRLPSKAWNPADALVGPLFIFESTIIKNEVIKTDIANHRRELGNPEPLILSKTWKDNKKWLC